MTTRIRADGNRLARQSAHGLDATADVHWSRYAACAQPGVDPDLWFSGHSAQANWSRVAQAIHICRRHCPVRSQCRRDMAPMTGAVIAGVFYNVRGQVSDYQPVLPHCGDCAVDRG